MATTLLRNVLPGLDGYEKLSPTSRKSLNEDASDRRYSDTSLESLASSTASKPPSWAGNDFVSNAIIGFADGLTVPFALTAGLTSFGSQQLVVVGGIAELVAGALSMGLGAYLAASTERTAYLVQERRELHEIAHVGCTEEQKIEETYAIFEGYGLDRARIRPMVDGLRANKDMWVKFLLDHNLKLDKPSLHNAWLCAVIMAVSYFTGGIVPMLPYFFVGTEHPLRTVLDALTVSICISVALLLGFGYVKAVVTGCGRRDAISSAVQTLLIGAVASGTSFGIVWALNHGLGGKAEGGSILS